MYVLDPLTMKLRDFDIHEPFPFIKGSIFGINADYEDNLWIATSKGLYCYKMGRKSVTILIQILSYRKAMYMVFILILLIGDGFIQKVACIYWNQIQIG